MFSWWDGVLWGWGRLGMRCALCMIFSWVSLHTILYLSWDTEFQARLHVRPADWDLLPLSVWIRSVGYLKTHRLPCNESDQSARMRRLIWDSVRRTFNLVGNTVLQFIYNIYTSVKTREILIIYAGLKPGVSIWGYFCKMCMHLENIGFLPVLWGS